LILFGNTSLAHAQAQEDSALPLRITTLQEEVDAAKKRETQLQVDFKGKMERLAELRK